jgi:hypothetical protein
VRASVVSKSGFHVPEEDQISGDPLLGKDPARKRKVPPRSLQAPVYGELAPPQVEVDPGEHATVDNHRVIEDLVHREKSGLGQGSKAVGDIGSVGQRIYTDAQVAQKVIALVTGPAQVIRRMIADIFVLGHSGRWRVEGCCDWLDG